MKTDGRKSDSQKPTIIARLRGETTLTIKRMPELTGPSKGANTSLQRRMRVHLQPLRGMV